MTDVLVLLSGARGAAVVKEGGWTEESKRRRFVRGANDLARLTSYAPDESAISITILQSQPSLQTKVTSQLQCTPPSPLPSPSLLLLTSLHLPFKVTRSIRHGSRIIKQLLTRT
jgi:hypothetical protein